MRIDHICSLPRSMSIHELVMHFCPIGSRQTEIADSFRSRIKCKTIEVIGCKVFHSPHDFRGVLKYSWRSFFSLLFSRHWWVRLISKMNEPCLLLAVGIYSYTFSGLLSLNNNLNEVWLDMDEKCVLNLGRWWMDFVVFKSNEFSI